MDTTPASPSPSAPHFAVARTLLDALAAHDLVQLGEALDVDASLAALLPRGFREWRGASEICAVFEGWFGRVDRFEVVDASVGQVGALLELSWRVRLKGARFGDEPMIVEQHAYAATGWNGRIERMSLLCSGFWKEDLDA